jgi:pyruvate dehydrogenase E2 component (dihydrolipoamide acetyltransferase)
MAKAVIMPVLGMSQDTGRLVKWLKSEGERVEAGEAIMEIETDKATVEIEALASGILCQISAVEGDLIPVGETIAFIAAPGETPQKGGQAPERSAKAEAPPVDSDSSLVSNEKGRSLSESNIRVTASPKARRLARERGLPLRSLVGSGPNGAIVAADVPGANGMRSSSGEKGEDHGLRVTERSLESRSATLIPEMHLRREVNAVRLLYWRDQIRERTKTDITHVDLLVRFLGSCLSRFPRLIASSEQQVGAPAINVGFLALRGADLVTPVIQRANELSFAEIAAESARLRRLIDQNVLSNQDLEGSTFLIADVGIFDLDSFDGPVAAPQVAALAVGCLHERFVSLDGKDQWAPVFQLTLSCDSQFVDRFLAATFLRSVVELIEDPTKLLTYI